MQRRGTGGRSGTSTTSSGRTRTPAPSPRNPRCSNPLAQDRIFLAVLGSLCANSHIPFLLLRKIGGDEQKPAVARRRPGTRSGRLALFLRPHVSWNGNVVLIRCSFCGSGCTSPPWRAKKNPDIRRSRLIWHLGLGTRRDRSTMAPTTWTWNCASRLTALAWYQLTVAIRTVSRKE
jgi:hypothetical protein